MKLFVPSARGSGSFLEMLMKNESEVCCGISGSQNKFRQRWLGRNTQIQTFHLQHDTQINPSAQAVSRYLSLSLCLACLQTKLVFVSVKKRFRLYLQKFIIHAGNENKVVFVFLMNLVCLLPLYFKNYIMNTRKTLHQDVLIHYIYSNCKSSNYAGS